MASEIPVVLFDGVCNLCNGWVNFAIDHARQDVRIHFGAIQSPEGSAVIDALDLDKAPLESIILVRNGKVYRESDAILQIMKLMRTPWNWLGVFRIVPRPIRDAVYHVVARNRYKWFGVRESCRLPDPESPEWFLSGNIKTSTAHDRVVETSS